MRTKQNILVFTKKNKTDDVFYDSIRIGSNSQSFKNKAEYLKEKVLEVYKTVPQKKLQAVTMERQADFNTAQISPDKALTAGDVLPKSNFGEYY